MQRKLIGFLLTCLVVLDLVYKLKGGEENSRVIFVIYELTTWWCFAVAGNCGNLLDAQTNTAIHSIVVQYMGTIGELLRLGVFQ